MSSVAVAQQSPEQAWYDLDEDVAGELVGGTLEDEEMPDAVHELVVVWFASLLKQWLGDRGLVLGSEAKFLLAPGLGRKPDLSLFVKANGMPPRRGPIQVAPLLMLEVLSRSPRDVRRDRIDKPAEYAAFGVAHLWLLDPEAETFEAFHLSPDGKYLRVAAGSTAVVTVPGLDGLVIDLGALWREVAELG